MPTSVLLVDDHPLFRKGLRLLLEEQEDIRIVGEAGDGREAIDRVRTLSPAITGIVVSEYKDLLTKSPSTAQVKDASPILDTKLHQPPIHENHIHRQRLLDRLDQRLQRPLTLVAAPAGYGKTIIK